MVFSITSGKGKSMLLTESHMSSLSKCKSWLFLNSGGRWCWCESRRIRDGSEQGRRWLVLHQTRWWQRRIRTKFIPLSCRGTIRRWVKELSGPLSSHSLSTMSRANNFKNKNLNPFTSLILVISIKLVFHATHLEQNNQYLKSYSSSFLHNASQLTHISYVCNSFIINCKHYTYCIAADPYLMSVILSS